MALSLFNLTRDPFDDFVTSLPSALMTAPSAGLSREMRQFTPDMHLDVKETENDYEIHADVPGMTKEDIHLDFDNGVLRISAERNEEKKEENDRWHVQERRWGSVTRAIRLPKSANPDDIKAYYKDGVLFVHVGKVPVEAKKAKSIRIE